MCSRLKASVSGCALPVPVVRSVLSPKWASTQLLRDTCQPTQRGDCIQPPSGEVNKRNGDVTPTTVLPIYLLYASVVPESVQQSPAPTNRSFRSGGPRRFLTLTAAFSVTHVAVLFASFAVGLSHPSSNLGRICAVVGVALLQPYMGIVLLLGRSHPLGPTPDWLDLSAFFLNSLVWGATISLIVCSLSRGKHRAPSGS